MRRTAGRCFFVSRAPLRRCDQGERVAIIELSPRVLDTRDRLRITLAHEMCHAAQWLLDGESKPPHGDSFKSWARVVESRVPGLSVTTRHAFEVYARHRYSCLTCGQQYRRHSRSLERRVCRCGGELHYNGAFDRTGRLIAVADAPPFASFVKHEYAILRRRWPRVTHQRIMQELGRKYRAVGEQSAAKGRSQTKRGA